MQKFSPQRVIYVNILGKCLFSSFRLFASATGSWIARNARISQLQAEAIASINYQCLNTSKSNSEICHGLRFRNANRFLCSRCSDGNLSCAICLANLFSPLETVPSTAERHNNDQQFDRRDKFRRFSANLKTFLSLPNDEVKGLTRFWPVHRRLERWILRDSSYHRILKGWTLVRQQISRLLSHHSLCPNPSTIPNFLLSNNLCHDIHRKWIYFASPFAAAITNSRQFRERSKKEEGNESHDRAVCGSSMDEESIIVHRNGVCCFMLRSSTQPPISTAIHFLQIEYFLLMSQFYGVFLCGNPICFLWPSTAFSPFADLLS